MKVDALVVGAGPAGCAAAARLAGDGARVVLAHRLSRRRHPSQCLPGSAARLLAAANLGDVGELTEGRCGGTLSAWGTTHLVASDGFTTADGAGWWVDRGRFDAALRQRCADVGVGVISGSIGPLRRDGRRWVASSPVGELSTPWLVDATGRGATVARGLGARRRVGPPLLAVHSRTVEAHDPPPARVVLETHPDGWWYLGASSRRRLGALAVVGPLDARRLVVPEGFLAQLHRTQHVRHWTDRHSRWTRPHVTQAGDTVLSEMHGDGWIACGDAAMTFDPLSSQGLIGALATGLDAARAIGSSDSHTLLRELAARHRDVSRTYRARCATAYAREHRWPDRPFWSNRIGHDETCG